MLQVSSCHPVILSARHNLGKARGVAHPGQVGILFGRCRVKSGGGLLPYSAAQIVSKVCVQFAQRFQFAQRCSIIRSLRRFDVEQIPRLQTTLLLTTTASMLVSGHCSGCPLQLHQTAGQVCPLVDWSRHCRDDSAQALGEGGVFSTITACRSCEMSLSTSIVHSIVLQGRHLCTNE